MVVLAVLLAVPCLGAAPQAITKGFGTVAWGEDVGKRQGFMKLRSDAGIDYFVNLRERYDMKGYGKPTVFYGQAGGRLYAVHLRLGDASGFDSLATELRKIYGKGKKDADGSQIAWKAGPVRVKLKKEAASGMKLSFYYQPVAATLTAAQLGGELSADELARLLPAGETQMTDPAGAMPAKQADYVGIDVLKYLREGSKILKVDIRKQAQ
jgi:hypothetical protein